MSEQSGYVYSAQCVKLQELVSRCNLKIEQTEENKKKFVSLQSQIDNAQNIVNSMNTIIGRIKPWIEDITDYTAQRKKEALLAVNSALSVANLVVPSSMVGIQFKVEGKEAWLENAQGMDADRLEGSGYKGTVSTYLRNIILKANPDLLQFMILDEPLAKLSAESSAVFSTYVPLLADKMQIIWIEHKKEVFSNVENKTVYAFSIGDNGYSKVVKEE